MREKHSGKEQSAEARVCISGMLSDLNTTPHILGAGCAPPRAAEAREGKGDVSFPHSFITGLTLTF